MISVILPAYKEADNLKGILPDLHKALKKTGSEYEIRVIDTMEEMDDTRAVCGQLGTPYLHRMGGDTYGDAIRTGISNSTGEYIVVMDSDGSHNPEDIVTMYKKMQEQPYTVVIGSRYCKGGNTENNFLLRLMSRALNITYRIVFGLHIMDVSDSYRMYDAGKLKALSLMCDNFDIVEEILIKLRYQTKDFSALEIPIRFNKRAFGESKRDLIKFIGSYRKTMRRLYAIKKNCKKEGGRYENRRKKT